MARAAAMRYIEVMRAWLKRNRKSLVWLTIAASPVLVYTALVLEIHINNARYEGAWDRLNDAATQAGLLVHHVNQPPDPPGLNRFYDESKPYPAPNGLTYHKVGYKDDQGRVVLESEFFGGARYFYEKLNYAYLDHHLGFINPDGSWAFVVEDPGIEHGGSFFNGRARVMRELSSDLTTPQWREGFIDPQGRIVVPLIYTSVSDYIGEKNTELALVGSRTLFAPIADRLMDGIDIEIPPIHWLFPAIRLGCIDKEGNTISLHGMRKSAQRLEEAQSTPAQ